MPCPALASAGGCQCTSPFQRQPRKARTGPEGQRLSECQTWEAVRLAYVIARVRAPRLEGSLRQQPRTSAGHVTCASRKHGLSRCRLLLSSPDDGSE